MRSSRKNSKKTGRNRSKVRQTGGGTTLTQVTSAQPFTNSVVDYGTPVAEASVYTNTKTTSKNVCLPITTQRLIGGFKAGTAASYAYTIGQWLDVNAGTYQVSVKLDRKNSPDFLNPTNSNLITQAPAESKLRVDATTYYPDARRTWSGPATNPTAGTDPNEIGYTDVFTFSFDPTKSFTLPFLQYTVKAYTNSMLTEVITVTNTALDVLSPGYPTASASVYEAASAATFQEDSRAKSIDDSRAQFQEDSRAVFHKDSRAVFQEDSRAQSIGDSRAQFVGDSRANFQGDSRAVFHKDSRATFQEDSRAQSIGDSRAQFVGDSRANFQGDSRAVFQEDSRSQVVGDSRAQFVGDSRAVFQQDSRADFQEDSKAQAVEDSRAQSVGDSRAQFVGDSRAVFQKDSRAVFQQDSRADFQEDSRATFQEDSRAQSIGDSRAQFVGDSRAQNLDDSRAHFVGDSIAEFLRDSRAEFQQDSRAVFQKDSRATFQEDSKAQHIEDSKAQQLEDSKAQQVGDSKAQYSGESRAQYVGESRADYMEDSKAQQLEDSKAQQVEDSKAQHVGDSKAQYVGESKAQYSGESKAQYSGESSAQYVGESKAQQVSDSGATFIDASSATHSGPLAVLRFGNTPSLGHFILPSGTRDQTILTNGFKMPTQGGGGLQSGGNLQTITMGRYVRLKPSSFNGDGFINISQIMVYNVIGVNVAPNGVAYATSTMKGAAPPYIVNDGTAKTRDLPNVWQAATADRDAEYIELDLGSNQYIYCIRILGVSTCSKEYPKCHQRMFNLRLEIRPQGDPGISPASLKYYSSGKTGLQASAAASAPTTASTISPGTYILPTTSFDQTIQVTEGMGRYVRIRPSLTSGDGFMNLSQVIVYDILGQNISRGMRTYATSTISGASPSSIVVDGNMGIRAIPYVWHSNTRNKETEFLEVDLGASHTIIAIRIIGRKDCPLPNMCENRMMGLRVEINESTTADALAVYATLEKPTVAPVVPGKSVDVYDSSASGDVKLTNKEGYVAVEEADPSLPPGYLRLWNKNTRRYGYQDSNGQIVAHPAPPSMRVDRGRVRRPPGIPVASRENEARMIGGAFAPLSTDRLVSSLTVSAPWKMYFDTYLRKHYYYNTRTGKDTWDHPYTPRRPLAGEVTYGDYGLTSSWNKYLESSIQTFFFYKPSTGETRWDHPNPPPAATGLRPIPGPYEPAYQMFRDGEGGTFYLNTKTQETVWELPQNSQNARTRKNTKVAVRNTLKAVKNTEPVENEAPRSVETSGAPRPVETSGAPKPVETSGAPRPVETSGAPKPVATAEDTSGAPKPVATAEDTSGAPKPVATAEDTSGAPKPSAEDASGAPKPVATAEDASGAPKPVATAEETSGAPKPVATAEDASGAPKPTATAEETSGAPKPTEDSEAPKAEDASGAPKAEENSETPTPEA